MSKVKETRIIMVIEHFVEHFVSRPGEPVGGLFVHVASILPIHFEPKK